MKKDSYLINLKKMFVLKIRPLDKGKRENINYNLVREFVNDLIQKDKLHEIFDYLFEGQYNIQLWTAHFLYLHKKFVPFKELKIAINIIKRYSKTPFDKILAEQEIKWLKENNKEIKALLSNNLPPTGHVYSNKTK